MMKALFLVLSLTLNSALSAQNATLKSDVAQTIGEIDPGMYGVFMAPVNCNGRMAAPDTAWFRTMTIFL